MWVNIILPTYWVEQSKPLETIWIACHCAVSSENNVLSTSCRLIVIIGLDHCQMSQPSLIYMLIEDYWKNIPHKIFPADQQNLWSSYSELWVVLKSDPFSKIFNEVNNNNEAAVNVQFSSLGLVLTLKCVVHEIWLYYQLLLLHGWLSNQWQHEWNETNSSSQHEQS